MRAPRLRRTVSALLAPRYLPLGAPCCRDVSRGRKSIVPIVTPWNGTIPGAAPGLRQAGFHIARPVFFVPRSRPIMARRQDRAHRRKGMTRISLGRTAAALMGVIAFAAAGAHAQGL